ncbi:shikimate dehydrogenase [Hahella sp. SMD15-11]|uniref:Shikimate dehydrogenase (NADP(+)) n=1 Tax=Thermohahella caldifontis TaxID=3142973 RepID=A0AB39UU71_9GAMM
MDRYAVIGHPVRHSKSPRIHQMFAEQTKQALTYTAIEAPLDGFAHTVRTFVENGGKGLNVTVPFKEEAFALAQQRTPLAERAGAVNTLYLEGEVLCGTTTDGVGLVRDLTDNLGLTLQGKRILVLGAGGAVRGVLEPLLARQPAALVIANRTASRAETLAELFAPLGPVEACAPGALEGPFDLIINGTAASLQGQVPDLPSGLVSEHTHTYDMMYGRDLTPFSRWALAQGAAAAHDGLGMLVEQAAESFFIWRGVRPATAPVLAALRKG